MTEALALILLFVLACISFFDLYIMLPIDSDQWVLSIAMQFDNNSFFCVSDHFLDNRLFHHFIGLLS